MPNLHNLYVSAKRKPSQKSGIRMKLLIAMYLQIQFELILTSNKAPIDNLKKTQLSLVMAAILIGGRDVAWHSFEKGPPKGNPSQILI